MNKFVAASVFAAASALCATVGVGSAAAATYDAFSSFNGVNGAGGFTYGYTDGTTMTAFDTSSVGGACALGAGSTCLYASSQGNLPQASVGGSYPTVSVPADAILVHPGNSQSASDFAGYTATSAGAYSYDIILKSVGIDTVDGTGYRTFTSLGGVVTLGARAQLPTYQSTGSLTGTQTLAVGEMFGVVVDDNTNYGGDSTGLNFSISAVPEPAAWGLMLAGFGLVGLAVRRRRSSIVVA